MTDGTDTIIGELIVPATKDEQGQTVHRQPEFTTEWMYAVAAEIEGASGTTNDGKEWSRNRIRIRKITKL